MKISTLIYSGRLRILTLACLLSLVFPASAVEPVTSGHGFRSLLKDQHWLSVPVEGFQTPSSQGIYREEWMLADDDGKALSDRYTGLRRRFDNGLGLDTGVAQFGVEPDAQQYREFYFGLSYDAWQGRVWYSNDYQGSSSSRSFYEFGVSGNLSEDVSLSARLGYGSSGIGLVEEQRAAYVLSAEKRDLYGFGLNLQLMGTGDSSLTDSEDLRVMGILYRPFR